MLAVAPINAYVSEILLFQSFDFPNLFLKFHIFQKGCREWTKYQLEWPNN